MTAVDAAGYAVHDIYTITTAAAATRDDLRWLRQAVHALLDYHGMSNGVGDVDGATELHRDTNTRGAR